MKPTPDIRPATRVDGEALEKLAGKSQGDA